MPDTTMAGLLPPPGGVTGRGMDVTPLSDDEFALLADPHALKRVGGAYVDEPAAPVMPRIRTAMPAPTPEPAAQGDDGPAPG